MRRTLDFLSHLLRGFLRLIGRDLGVGGLETELREWHPVRHEDQTKTIASVLAARLADTMGTPPASIRLRRA